MGESDDQLTAINQMERITNADDPESGSASREAKAAIG
jgi:hypothetical protein